MALGGSRAKRRKHVLLIVALALFMLATGLVAGFFIAKSIGTYMLTHCHAANSVPTGPPPAAAADAISSRNASGFRPGAVKAISVRFRELPDPGTGEADALRAAPNADGVALELYRWFDDAILITEELTAAFLSRLEQQLADNQATNNQQPSVTTEEMSTIISTFIAVARDLLNYLRYHNSVALLPLLRQFSVEGTFTVTDINPDDLQREVYGLLNLTSMGHWYSTTSSFDTHSMRMEAYPTTSTSLPKQGSAELLADSTTAPGGKRLLSHAWQTKPHHRQRQLQAVNSIPTIPLQEALAEVVIPTDSPVLTLEDMLCAVKHNSPSGLDGMYLPSKAVNSTKKPIKCKPPPKLGLFRHGNVVFKPVVIPVVFHCQRFMQGDVLQPPMWKAEEGAANLIKVSNQKFKGTGIQ